MGHGVIRAGKNLASWRTYVCLFAHVLFKYGHSVRRRCRNTPGVERIRVMIRGTVIMVAAHMHEPTSLIYSLQTRGLATVIRPLVLVSGVSNIGEMHVLNF